MFEFIIPDATGLFTVTTEAIYVSNNVNVQLSVYFTDYSTTCFTVADGVSTKTLTLDSNNIVSFTSGTWTETLQRRVMLNWSLATEPTASDDGWVSSLDLSFTVRVFDCNYDFSVPVDNFNRFSGQESSVDSNDVHRF